MHRTLRIALTALTRNTMRSVLTCLGIVIGIAAVIAMVEIGLGSSHAIQQAIARMGANVVQIDPSDAVKAGVSTGGGGRVTLTPADCDAIGRCPGVNWAAPSVDCHVQIVYGNKNYAPRKILGTAPDYLLICDWGTMQAGVAFTDDDVRRVAHVCILGQGPAQALFGELSPVGKEIRVNNVSLKVIGLLRRKGASMTGQDLDDIVLVPWTTLKYRLSGLRQPTNQPPADPAATTVNSLDKLYPAQPQQLYPSQSAAQLADLPMMIRFSDIDDIWVSAASASEIDQVKKQITLLLRQRHRLEDSQPDDFRIRDWTEISETIASTSRLITNLLLCIAMISLVVGGVGIMNIMLVSVTERTREIGLRMAVGARAGDILRQFLLEAALLCFAGGIVGVALGKAVSAVVTAILRWPTVTSIPAILAAVAVATSVGILFGYYPAWKASRLDPIDALRHE